MIAFFHRREVYIGMDCGRFSRVCGCLSDAGIKYETRTENTGGRLRGGCLYYVYVHRNDFGRAAGCLRGIK